MNDDLSLLSRDWSYRCDVFSLNNRYRGSSLITTITPIAQDTGSTTR
jgi:hypothetical protein